MMDKLSRWLYQKNKKFFFDLFLVDMIGNIPDSVQEPTSDFLARSGKQMEAWLLHQSWILQRKAAAEPKFSEIYVGMMLEIKILLLIATRKQIINKVSTTATVEEPEDPLKGVEAFMKKGKV